MTTAEMLKALAEDSRIISVEPNYTTTFDETTAEDAGAAETEAAHALLETASEVGASAGEDVETSQNTVGQIADLSHYQWSLKNDDTTIKDGTAATGFDINSPNWDTGVENAVGVVATLDTGLDITHPDLEGVVMTTMKDYNQDGGQSGINLSNQGAIEDVSDPIGHGTHVAGIIASEWDGSGTSGVANGAKLVSVKLGTADGQISMADAVAGYAYLEKAVDNGLNLVAVTNSWGDIYMCKALSTMVTCLGEKGVVSVCFIRK
ncbi:MAG: S8 family serine peptidase [Eubacterium aggregans]